MRFLIANSPSLQSERVRSPQIRSEEIERNSDCGGLHCNTAGTVGIDARGSENHASHPGAATKKYIVARVRKDFQRRMRDRLCESLGAGGWRRDLIGTARDDPDRDRNSAEAFQRNASPTSAPSAAASSISRNLPRAARSTC